MVTRGADFLGLRFLYYSNFSRVSIAILVSIAVLPLAGGLILIGCVGSFVLPSFVVVRWSSLLVGGVGWWLLANINLLFALVIGAAWSRNTIAGVVSSFWVFMVSSLFTGFVFGVTGEMLSSGLPMVATAFYTIAIPLHFVTFLGFASLDMGLAIGIVAGGLGAFVCNRHVPCVESGTGVVSWLSAFVFLRGVLVVGLMGMVAAIFAGAIFSVVYPFVQYLIYVFSDGVSYYLGGMPRVLSFLYGVASMLLSPFGLHHLDTLQISYANLGGESDLPYRSIAPTMFNNVALMASIFAIYRSINIGVRSSYRLIFIGGGLTVLFTGYASSMGFLLVFLSPILYLVYVIFSGIGSVLMAVFGIHVYSGSLSALLVDVPAIIRAGLLGSLVRLVVVGLLYGGAVYFVFRVLINFLKVNAPGRGFNTILTTLNFKAPTTCSLEAETGRFFDIRAAQLQGEHPSAWQQSSSLASDTDAATDTDATMTMTMTVTITMEQLQVGFGGADNIVSLEVFQSGIRATLVDAAQMEDAPRWKLHYGAVGVIRRGNDVRVLYTQEYLPALRGAVSGVGVDAVADAHVHA